MFSTFDHSAELYNASIPPLPEKYIRLIQACFDLKRLDMVVDLGCGAGTLALALTLFSSFVQGLDASEAMLKIACGRDIQRCVRWVHSSVEKYDFGSNHYKLIMSFESFHLFSDPISLIKKCVVALKPDGYLCVGWVNYEWETLLKDIIVDVFNAYGIGWEDWNYWSCPGFSVLIKESNVGLSDVVTKSIEVEAKTELSAVASYLVSIERASSLGERERQQLAQELEERFRLVTSTKWGGGIACYSLAFCRKLVY